MGNFKAILRRNLIFAAVFSFILISGFGAKTVYAGDCDVTLTFELENSITEYKTGDIIPIKIIVENFGPAPAENVRVEFALPEGMEYLSSDFSSNTGYHNYSQLTNTYEWIVNTMDTTYETAWIKVSVLDPGDYIIKAALTTDSDDYKLSDNSGRIYISAEGRSVSTVIQKYEETKRPLTAFFSGQTVNYTKNGEGFVEFDLTKEQFRQILNSSYRKEDKNVVIKPGVYGLSGFMLDLDLETLSYYKFYEYFEINCVNFTLGLPQKLMAELYGKYASNVSVSIRKTSSGYDLKFFHKGVEIQVDSPLNPVLLGIKHDGNLQRNEAIVMYSVENGVKSPISRSWHSSDTKCVWAKIYTGGSYGCEYKGLKGFPDTAGKWMDSAVEYLNARNIIASDESGLFNPNKEISRLEYIVMVIKALGLEETAPSGLKRYEDIESIPAEYRNIVALAGDLGLISSDGFGYFRPENSLTREEMFTVAYKAFNRYQIVGETPLSNVLGNFSDWPQINADARRPILYMLELDLISKNAKALYPQNAATKAEAAQFLSNVLHYDWDR